jgi:hypothetical protein
MQKHRFLSIILVASIVLSIFWTVPPPPIAKADGEVPPGWLQGYTYRKKHTITGAANAGIGYQMMFKVRRASGTDSDNIVYVSTKCKEDFSDVRFADADGNVFTYAVTYRTADEAWFWIKPSVDLSADQNIYIYYGNPDAHDESNVDQTFIFAEDWSNSTLQPRWQLVSGSYDIDPSQKLFHSCSNNLMLKSANTVNFPSSYVVESFMGEQYSSPSFTMKAKPGDMYGTSTLWWRGGFSIASGNISTSDYGVAYANFGGSYPQQHFVQIGVGHGTGDAGYSYSYNKDNIYTEQFTIQRNSSNYFFVQVVGKMNWTEANVESSDRIYLFTFGSCPRDLWVGGFKIRKYVSPEPAHGTWYSEEAITIVEARLNVNVEPSWLSYVAFTLDYPTQILFAPWSNIIGTGQHTLTVLDEKVNVNSTYVYGFKCWKKAGEIVSFDKNYTFTLSPGTTDITIVYVAHNVTVVSDPEMYVRLTVDGWELTTPSTIYRGSGYYNFEALDTQIYYNATHMLTFYGWYVDNIYIGSSATVNIYISYNTQIKLAYKAVEIPAPPPMTFKAQIVDLGTVQADTSKDFAITVMFDAATITITSVEFQARGEWLQITDTLPMQASRGLEAMGTATIQARLTAPQNTQGYYSIPFKVIGKTSDGTTITTASYLTFTITTTPQITETTTITTGGFAETITRIFGNPLLLMLLIALIIWLSAYSLKNH